MKIKEVAASISYQILLTKNEKQNKVQKIKYVQIQRIYIKIKESSEDR